MKINSLGTFTVATEFVPLFPTKSKQFEPLVIKRIYYEDKEIKTEKSASSTGDETESRVTPQDQQAAPSTI